MRMVLMQIPDPYVLINRKVFNKFYLEATLGIRNRPIHYFEYNIATVAYPRPTIVKSAEHIEPSICEQDDTRRALKQIINW